MRQFHFYEKKFKWSFFKEEGVPNVQYGKHSFFIYDSDFLYKQSNLKLPDGYGVKVFKKKDWQGTDVFDVAIIQNIFWIHGLGPRVKEVLKVKTETKKTYWAHLEEVVSGRRKRNIKNLEKVGRENFITINHGSGDELENGQNWREGKYIDFGGFKIDKEAYKTKLIKQIDDVTHYGCLMGETRNSYQSIDDWGVVGKRKTQYRIDKMKLDKIDFKDKSVIDIGCNLGLMLHYAGDKGATSLTGYDFPEVIKVAKEYANFRERFNYDFFAQNLAFVPPKGKADIVFYLAMSQYLGFPKWLKGITNEILIYEGHENTSPNAAEAFLRELFPKVVSIGITEDRSVRPLFMCYK